MKFDINYKVMKKAASKESAHIDSKSDIENHKIDRKMLWESAFICGVSYMKECVEKAWDEIK